MRKEERRGRGEIKRRKRDVIKLNFDDFFIKFFSKNCETYKKNLIKIDKKI